MALLLKEIVLLSLVLGCSQKPTGSLTHNSSDETGNESVTVPVETNGEAGTAEVDSSLTTSQLIEFDDVLVSIPPGSLAIDTEIRAEPALDRSSETKDLGVEAEAAGAPVLITSLNGAELMAPLTLALDIPSGLNLNSSGELSVFYHMKERGVYTRGLIYGSNLKIEGNKAIFTTMGFGFFQLVYVKNLDALKKPSIVENKSPNEVDTEKKKEVASKKTENEKPVLVDNTTTKKPVPNITVSTETTPKPEPTPQTTTTPQPEPTPQNTQTPQPEVTPEPETTQNTPVTEPENYIVTIDPLSNLKVGDLVTCSSNKPSGTTFLELAVNGDSFIDLSIGTATVTPAMVGASFGCKLQNGSENTYSPISLVSNTSPSPFSYSCQQPILARGATFGSVTCSHSSPLVDQDLDSLSVSLAASTTCPGPIVPSELETGFFSFVGTGSIIGDCLIKWNLTDGRGGKAFTDDQVILVREQNVSSVSFSSHLMFKSEDQCKVSMTADVTKRHDLEFETIDFNSTLGAVQKTVLGSSSIHLGYVVPTASLVSGFFVVGVSSLQQNQSQFSYTESFALSKIQMAVLPDANSLTPPSNGSQFSYNKTLPGCTYCSGEITQISVGNRYAAFKGSNGTYAWGDSLGNGRTGKTLGVNSRYFVSKIPGTTGNDRNIDLGNSATCVVNNQGKPNCMGDNVYGALGTSSLIDILEPRRNSLTSDSFAQILSDVDNGEALQVVTYDDNTLILLSNGNVAASGSSNKNLLGSPATTPEFDGVLVRTSSTELLQDVKQISLGGQLAMALAMDDDGPLVYTWGQNTHGQLGLGDNTVRTDANTVTLPSGVVPVHVAAGGSHGCILTSLGEAYCFGRNLFGQLGSGLDTDSDTPQIVKKVGGGILTGIVAISASKDSTHFIVKNGYSTTLYSTGKNTNGQLGVGDKVNRFLATQAVNNFSQAVSDVLAVDGGGNNVCILGRNAASQLRVSCVGEDTGVVVSSTDSYPGADVTSFNEAWSLEIDRGEICDGYSIGN